MGNRLFEEAKLLLSGSDRPAFGIPDAQALSLLALHQLLVGQYTEAIHFADEGIRQMTVVREDGKFRSSGLDSSSPSVQATTLCSTVALAR